VLYEVYEYALAFMWSAVQLARVGAQMFSAPGTWLAQLPGANRVAAAYELLYRLTKDTRSRHGDDISARARRTRHTTFAAEFPRAAAPADHRSHGHHGVFSGRRWREFVYPRLRDFIAEVERSSLESPRGPSQTSSSGIRLVAACSPRHHLKEGTRPRMGGKDVRQ
jgi:poly-beta-hydroxyalkanoate depolymerase